MGPARQAILAGGEDLGLVDRAERPLAERATGELALEVADDGLDLVGPRGIGLQRVADQALEIDAAPILLLPAQAR